MHAPTHIKHNIQSSYKLVIYFIKNIKNIAKISGEKEENDEEISY